MVPDGCPTLGQDEDPGTPGLLPRQPHQATQHDPEHCHPDEDTQGYTGVCHRHLHAGPRRHDQGHQPTVHVRRRCERRLLPDRRVIRRPAPVGQEPMARFIGGLGAE
jgi:hypothetical protein